MKAIALTACCLLAGLSLFAPLSEFGRYLGLEVLLSILFSSAVGLMVMVLTAAIGTVVALALLRSDGRWSTSVASVIADILDAVPAVLWVLAFVVVVDEHRRLVAPCVFVLLAAPSAVRIFVGESRRQSTLPYVLAARAIGVSTPRLFFRHILPNARDVVVPFLLQIFGGAVAIDGAIGVLGAGNRSDLNLGTLLLRGKEQALLSPWLLAMSLLAYLAVFSVLFIVEDQAKSRRGFG